MALATALDPLRIPAHVACVMDGNGRWAQQRGLKRTDGHLSGIEAMYDVAHGAADIGIEWLTVYAFSTENWNRPGSEVRFLMRLQERLLKRRLDELHDRNVRLRILGRPDDRVPRRVVRQMDAAVERTQHNTAITLSIAFNYGGRAEIVDAMRAVLAAGVTPDAVTEDAIRANLYAPDMPDPDVVIRTSGEYRLSNFLLWESAYSELVFTDVLWPDFRREQLYGAVAEYQGRTRRFGGLANGAAATITPPAAVGGRS